MALAGWEEFQRRLAVTTELCLGLDGALDAAEARVRFRLPAWAAQRGREEAEGLAVRAICEGRAARMTPAAWRRWLHLVVHRRAINVLRRRPTTSLPVGLASPEPAAYGPVERGLVLEAVGRLGPEDRALVEAFFFDKLSVRKAASRLGLPPTTAIHRKRRALARLRESFEELEYECEIGRYKRPRGVI